MPAVGPLIMAGGMLGSTAIGSLAANSAAKAAAQRTPEEQGLFEQSRRQGLQMFGAAMPRISSTLDYYQTLLSGDRQARLAAAAPEAEDVSSAYQGADAAVRRQLTGGERQQALAENARQRAGQIARLVTGQRQVGAQGIASLAPNLAVAGTSGTQGLLTNEMYNRMQANQIGLGVGSNTAQSLGSLIAMLAPIFNKTGTTPGRTPGKGPVTPFSFPLPKLQPF